MLHRELVRIKRLWEKPLKDRVKSSLKAYDMQGSNASHCTEASEGGDQQL